VVRFGERTVAFAVARDGETVWLGREGRTWAVRELERVSAGDGPGSSGGGVLRSPMPGTVLAVKVSEGDRVEQGQPIVVVEAMKMEHAVTAPLAGVVRGVTARVGDQVRLDEALAEIVAEES
jgi:acetyl-CoA/propionyl-CoA carboxylase biotin carboxyl carrier protein